MTQNQIIKALKILRPTAIWSIGTEDLSGLIWQDEIQLRPTDDEIIVQIGQF